MSLIIDENLPAYNTLILEGIDLLNLANIGTLNGSFKKIALFNLMPTKIETETQLLRSLSNSKDNILVTFVKLASHKSINTSKDHLDTFYVNFHDISKEYFDGIIITGAPVETLEFEDVDYWEELCNIFDWSKTNSKSTFNICWGAQASLYYNYGIKKQNLDKKLFGVFEHRLYEQSKLTNGFNERFFVPHSRHTTINKCDIENIKSLKIISSSPDSGVYLIRNDDFSMIFATGHSEYDSYTLKNEYLRDINKGMDIEIPKNYFKDNNPKNEPIYSWKNHSNSLFSNWVHNCTN